MSDEWEGFYRSHDTSKRFYYTRRVWSMAIFGPCKSSLMTIAQAAVALLVLLTLPIWGTIEVAYALYRDATKGTVPR